MIRVSRFKRFFSLFLLAGGLLGMGVAAADPGCQNAQVIGPKLITDICWSCLFPIRIAGVPISGAGGRIPEEAVKSPLCTCRDGAGLPRPGVTTSMWEPARLVEFQRVPGCSSVLNGMRFPFNRTFQGHHGTGDLDGGDGSFMHIRASAEFRRLLMYLKYRPY